MKRKLLLFLYSRANVVGSILGLLGLGLFFGGVIKHYWFFIVAGLYIAGVLITPRKRTYDLHLQKRHFDTTELERELERLVTSIRKRVSPEILAKVESIKASILAILPKLGEFDGTDHNTYEIRQTALEYLPTALENYLNLPQAFARFHPVQGKKTARQLLLEQLDLLDREMKQIVTDIHRNDTQRLMAHGRFLASKFKKDELWLGDSA